MALIGPRQVGKTTQARRLADAADSVYLDLEDPVDLAKLDDAAGYLRALRRRLVVIDKVQRAPGLFQLLRVLIDERIRAGESGGQFLLLGSAAPELLGPDQDGGRLELARLRLRPTRHVGLGVC